MKTIETCTKVRTYYILFTWYPVYSKLHVKEKMVKITEYHLIFMAIDLLVFLWFMWGMNSNRIVHLPERAIGSFFVNQIQFQDNFPFF